MDLTSAKRIAEQLELMEADHGHLTCGYPKMGMYLWVDNGIPDDSHSMKAGVVFVGPEKERISIPDTLCDERLQQMCAAYKLMIPEYPELFMGFIRHVVFEREPTKRAAKFARVMDRLALIVGDKEW